MRLVLVDLGAEGLKGVHEEAARLMYPLQSEMDLNISVVLKAAAVGLGTDFATRQAAKCQSKVMLSGLGADEYFCGYSRHRVAFLRGGLGEMNREMLFDQNRLWVRNLGRDDRVVSSEGREVRTPFLTRGVIEFSKQVPLQLLSSMKAKGSGVAWRNKKVLRRVARSLGLSVACELPKKAIQFGSGLAKESNCLKYGSHRKAKGQFKAKGFSED